MGGKGAKRQQVAKATPDVLAERLEAMRELVPEALSEGKIDFEKLRVALGEAVDDSPERYSFTRARKMKTRHEAAAVSVLDSE